MGKQALPSATPPVSTGGTLHSTLRNYLAWLIALAAVFPFRKFLFWD